jgi:hypothetical protein
VQQGNAIGRAHGLVRIVRHENGGGARLAQEVERVLSHLVAQASVEAREGLVHEQHARAGASARASATRWRSPPDSVCG